MGSTEKVGSVCSRSPRFSAAFQEHVAIEQALGAEQSRLETGSVWRIGQLFALIHAHYQ